MDYDFIIHDFLTNLKERDELDTILPDLLRAMGFQIVRLAFRGEAEHGVDIAATKKEGGKLALYLFQVKAGHIDRQLWNTDQNSVQQTLDDLLLVRFEDLTQPELRLAKRKAVLVHNGILRKNVQERFNGYLDIKFKPYMDFDRWDLDKLSGYFQQYLFNERLLPKEYQLLMRKTLTSLTTNNPDLNGFFQIVQELTNVTKKLSIKELERTFSLINLLLAIVSKNCADNNNLTPAIAAQEYALLKLWGWLYRNKLFNLANLEKFKNCFQQYLEVLTNWVHKLAPALNMHEGLFYGNTFELVEYPLRTFQVISNLGFLCIAQTLMANQLDLNQSLQTNIELLKKTILNNPSRHRPLLDNHSIDIFLGIYALYLSGQKDIAEYWLSDLFKYLEARKNLQGRLPELYNNLEAVVEYEATNERPIGYEDSSSFLLYMLYEFCLLLNNENLYVRYQSSFKNTNLQVWYPPPEVEPDLYSKEIFDGDTETSIRLRTSFKEFFLDMQARHKTFDKKSFTPIEQGFPVILLLASKHYRTPIFPFWWRELIM